MPCAQDLPCGAGHLFHTKADGGQAVEVARGRLTVVCVAKDKQTNQMKAVAIPSEIRAKIEVAPPGLLPDKD